MSVLKSELIVLSRYLLWKWNVECKKIRNLLCLALFFFTFYHLIIISAAANGSENETHKELHRIKRSLATVRNVILSNMTLYAHLKWPGKMTFAINTINFDERTYTSYGQCQNRWPVYYYQHIMKASDLQLIIQAYAEMFRLSCKPYVVKTMRDLFEKGYARLEIDHSICYSDHTILFIKSLLTFQDMDDLENLMEFAAFTQTYVSWFKFPVKPIDPIGNELSDGCFIEVVARLHVLDLIMIVSHRHLQRMSYLMGVKLKTVIKIMCDHYRSLKGHDEYVEWQRNLAKRCLTVTMALLQFFHEYSATVGANQTECAHITFQRFYKPREKAFSKKAEKYGKIMKRRRKLNLDEDYSEELIQEETTTEFKDNWGGESFANDPYAAMKAYSPSSSSNPSSSPSEPPSPPKSETAKEEPEDDW